MNKDQARRASYKKQTAMIKRLLAQRHREDIFCLECRNGPSQSAAPGMLKILDAWAMKRTYMDVETYGYEIKVSRSDFKRDEKWRDYLKYCSYFYFVTPQGLIKPGELPPEVGLIEASKNFKYLTVRQFWHCQPIEDPVDIYRYLLINRATIDNKNVGGLSEMIDRPMDDGLPFG